MPAYRLYVLDGAGKVAKAEWLEATDDETAVDEARAVAAGRRSELWQRQRLIGRLSADGTLEKQAD